MVRAFAQRTEHCSPTHENDELGWLEAPELNEVSPASLWALDDEPSLQENAEEITASETDQRYVEANEPGWLDSAGVEEDSQSIEPALDREDDTSWWSKPDIFEAPQEVRESVTGERGPEFEAAEADPCTVANEADEPQPDLAAYSDDLVDPEITLDGSPISVHQWQDDAPEDAADSAIVPVQSEALSRDTSPPSPDEHQFEIPRPRVLDESAILPNEASFATVVLNREVPSRPRLLDESAILPSEASFATVALNNTNHVPSYSPAREFVARSTFRLKRLSPVLLLLAVGSGAVFFGLKFKVAEGIFSSPSAAENSIPNASAPQAKATTVQTHSQNVAASVKSAPATVTSGETSGSLVPAPVPAKVVVASEKEEIPPRAIDHKVTSGASKDARSSLKRSATTRNNGPSRKIRVSDSPSQRTSEKRTEPTSNAEESSRQSEAVPAGGGERPRRVKPDSQTTPPKPKVIVWP